MKGKLKLPVYLDAPEKSQIGIGLFYAFVSFFAMPFFVYFLMADLKDPYLLTWFEAAYHVINLVVAISIFREYLADALSLFWMDRKSLFLMIRVAVIVMLLYIAAIAVAGALTDSSLLDSVAMLVLPISETQILFFPIDMIYYNPIVGVICAVLLSPIIISCLYYCTGFVPAFNKWPWLGYVVVTVLVGFFQIRNNVTAWDLSTEIIMFAFQLPIHLIACWAYRRANNICAPIFTLSLANLLACGQILWQIFLGQ